MSTDIVSARLDDLKIETLDGEEWSARDLLPLAGYSQWRDWAIAIKRAMTSVASSGLNPEDHFAESRKLVETGSGARREIEDYRITRYGCYILFQNADGSKPEIAAVQAYFAVQTRRQELSSSFDVQSLDGIKAILSAANAAVAELEVAKPKADAWDALASAEGDFEVADAAKILARDGVQTGRQRLFGQMQEIGWLYRGADRRWRAYQEPVERRYLAERPQFHYHPATGEKVIDAPQIRVTVRGLDALRRRFSKTLAVTA